MIWRYSNKWEWHQHSIHFARYFFREVRRALGPEGQRLVRVRVWEAPGCSASYSE